MEIVINKCFGGFCLSIEARNLYAKKKGFEIFHWSDYDLKRNDSLLVEVVNELGEKASGNLSSLKVVEIPDDVDWEIDEYDGMEWVAEKHRTWD